MNDTIYRCQAIDTMQMFIDSLDKESPAYKSLSIAFDRCIIELKRMPSAQPQRKTGKWIYHSNWEADGECGYECSECGMGSDVDYNYCMRCGARMVKEGEEHD